MCKELFEFIMLERKSQSTKKLSVNNNRLLTKRGGRTGEYWPEVTAVRTERSTEGKYSPV